MNINSVTPFTGIQFDTSQALSIKNDNLKEEEKAADEITYIPWEDTLHQKCIGKDGKQFEVVSYYKFKGEILNKDYIDVFSSIAQGNEAKSNEYYIKNFIAEITKNFSDKENLNSDEESLKNGINNLIDEMKNNNSKGITNDIENLNTKLHVNGVDFTFKELMSASKAMDYSSSFLPTVGSGLDYENYAEMGIALGKIKTYAEKNLNADQQNLLNYTMSARVQKVIDSVPETIYNPFIKKIMVDENNKFYSIKNVVTATNKEYALKIMDTFANVDYSSEGSFKKATEEYKSLIKPVLEAAGVINIGRNHALTDVTNYQIKQFKMLYDETYKRVFLTPDEFRKKFETSKNVIDLSI